MWSVRVRRSQAGGSNQSLLPSWWSGFITQPPSPIGATCQNVNYPADGLDRPELLEVGEGADSVDGAGVYPVLPVVGDQMGS